LPSGAGKGAALAYLRRSRLGSTTRILVCGDSGNDLDMLTLGLPAVVVSNASPEVRAAALPPTVYQAQAPYAGGILEAIDHYQFGGTGPSPL
jgi:hydroxymethylpyrimidine pyrophosphatase-like HAD family hydrolase